MINKQILIDNCIIQQDTNGDIYYSFMFKEDDGEELNNKNIIAFHVKNKLEVTDNFIKEKFGNKKVVPIKHGGMHFDN